MKTPTKAIAISLITAFTISISCQEKRTTVSAFDYVKSMCEVTNSKGKTIEDVSKSALGISIYTNSETLIQFEENLKNFNAQTKEQWHQTIEKELINDPVYMNKLKPFLIAFEKSFTNKNPGFNEESINKAFQDSKCFALYQLLPTLFTLAEEK